ncbi:hypothetical protein [Dehalobacter sp. 14DCB1]|uniref:hypothetical protein n=1 Tax=Dehalobacter sp. 14DCB1 TaxID=2070227 RepID=UPI00104C90D6|nr:hypothetical protein [Dehalobacter sp. 14DCB1]TCX53842.1 hypothetical protein C1I36_03670 [Dehalobacter sp. 14DCB1]
MIFQIIYTCFLAAAVGIECLMYHKLTKYIELVSTPPAMEDFFSEDELSRIEKNKAFDERIAELREELGMEVEVRLSATEPAVELHPNVKNIPHDAVRIDGYNSLPDVEWND